MNNQLKRCYLQNLDKRQDIFVFQFTPQSVTIEQSSNIKSTPALNRQNPLIQWLHGNLVTISFEGIFFAKDSTDEILSKTRELQSFWERDERLGRPPICFWGYGTEVGFKCMVQKLGSVNIGELRSDGRLREVRFNITLFKFTEAQNREAVEIAGGRSVRVKEG